MRDVAGLTGHQFALLGAIVGRPRPVTTLGKQGGHTAVDKLIALNLIVIRDGYCEVTEAGKALYRMKLKGV